MRKLRKFLTTAAPAKTLIAVMIVSAVLVSAALVLLWWQGERRDRAIEELAEANLGNEQALAVLCADQPEHPACERAEQVPDTDEIIDEAEIQDEEIDDPDPIDDPDLDDPDPNQPERQEQESQERERQEPETQESEQQDGEVQDDEVQDGDPDDPDPNDPDPTDDPDPDDPDPNDPDPTDDPDPNLMLNFQFADNCNPGPNEVIVDVDLDVQRSDGAVTYILSCQTMPFLFGP